MASLQAGSRSRRSISRNAWSKPCLAAYRTQSRVKATISDSEASSGGRVMRVWPNFGSATRVRLLSTGISPEFLFVSLHCQLRCPVTYASRLVYCKPKNSFRHCRGAAGRDESITKLARDWSQSGKGSKAAGTRTRPNLDRDVLARTWCGSREGDPSAEQTRSIFNYRRATKTISAALRLQSPLLLASAYFFQLLWTPHRK